MILIIMAIMFAFCLTACGCEHEWKDANCIEAKTCSLCQKTEGDPLGHVWQDATCTMAKTCSVCNFKEGNALGHDWQDATCDAPKTCTRCHKTEGKALKHSWIDATPTNPKTCELCKITEGSPLQPCDACENTGKIECTSCVDGLAKCDQCKGGKTVFCANCAGEKIIACTSCKGSGRGPERSKKCSGCKGSGYLDFRCYSCGGRGISINNGAYGTCSKCNGYGYFPMECWFCNHRGYTTYYEKCSTCKGKGTIKDTDCKGSGKISCEACAGKGTVDCTLCSGTLIADCRKCQGTGWLSAEAAAEPEKLNDGSVFLCSAVDFTVKLNHALASVKTIVPGYNYNAKLLNDEGEAQLAIDCTKEGSKNSSLRVAELSFAIGGDALEYNKRTDANVIKGFGGIVDGTAHSQVVMTALLCMADPTVSEADALGYVNSLNKKSSVQVNELTYQISANQKNPAIILLHLPEESK